MTEQPLTLEQIASLAEKTLANSVALLDEADGFLYLGHYPRAFALGVLAAEEFGKHMMCHGIAAFAGKRSGNWDDFFKRFRNHQPKYENAVSMALGHVVDEERRDDLLRAFTDIVKNDQARKLSGLYVDIRDGEAVSPEEAIDEGLAEETLFVLNELIRNWAARFAGADWFEVFQRGLDAGGYEVASALEAGDQEEVARLFAAMRARTRKDS
jgi:AbiV family abortive infection protein